MRLIPVFTALLVTFALYAIVFEREALLAFARGSESTEAASSETGEETAAESEAASETPEKRIRVVVQHSTAKTIDNAVILRGETAAVREVEVRAETAATVISEPLRKGTFVEAGDVLCELDHPGDGAVFLAMLCCTCRVGRR